jgi:hypothetical protein
MRRSLKRFALVALLLAVVAVTSSCQGTMHVGVAYPGPWGYGPYSPYGPTGGIYVGGTVPIW